MQRVVIIFAILIILGGLASPTTAYAGEGGGGMGCETTEGIFTGRIIYCIHTIITTTSMNFLSAFETYLRPFVYAVITLAFTLFGVRTMMGETEIVKKGAGLLIKIGAVLLFTQGNLAGMGEAAFAVMGDIVEIIGSSMIDAASFQCDLGADAAGGITVFGWEIWNSIDCMVVRLFGAGSPASNSILTFSLVGLAGASLFSGTFGIMVFLLGIATLLTMLLFAFRAAFTFVVSYVYVAFLLVISPLIIPTILFQTTARSFDAWMRDLIAGMALPGIITAFLIIAVPAIDYVFNTPPESGISLMELISSEDMEEAYRNPEQKCQAGQGGRASEGEQGVVEFLNRFDTEELNSIEYQSVQSALNQLMAGSGDLCAFFTFPSIDFGENTDQILLDVALSLFSVIIVVWLMKSTMEALVQMLVTMIGGFALTMVAGSNNPVENRMKRVIGATKRRMEMGLK